MAIDPRVVAQQSFSWCISQMDAWRKKKEEDEDGQPAGVRAFLASEKASSAESSVWPFIGAHLHLVSHGSCLI